MTKSVRTRFAPSPTGMLHIGGVRTALFAYLYAKANNGTFILRLEDTDRERFVEKGVKQLIDSLDWLGIHPDEGFWFEDIPKPHGSYIQSERLPHYQQLAQQLVKDGRAYYSTITTSEFLELKNKSITSKKAFVYRQSMEPNQQISLKHNKYPIRLKISQGITKWRDEVRGDFETNNNLIDDFVILKADGYPTYNFAHIIDDYMMQISHVIRGDEFLSSMPKYAYLLDTLGFTRPTWIHLPTILGSDGRKKLSKREGDIDVLDYKKKGYLPEALLNYLALLGWNDGTKQELFSLKDLIAKFSISGIQKSPAQFDIERLNWMNGEYIRLLSIDQLSLKLKDYLPKKWFVDEKYFKKVLSLDKERIKTLSDAEYVMKIFFESPKVDKKLLTSKNNIEEIKKWLKICIEVLSKCDFEHEILDKKLREVAGTLGIKTGELFFALRITLTGRSEAPGLIDIMQVLGKKQTLNRLNQQL